MSDKVRETKTAMKEMKEERESSDEDDEPSSKASRDLAEMLKRRLLGGS